MISSYLLKDLVLAMKFSLRPDIDQYILHCGSFMYFIIIYMSHKAFNSCNVSRKLNYFVDGIFNCLLNNVFNESREFAEKIYFRFTINIYRNVPLIFGVLASEFVIFSSLLLNIWNSIFSFRFKICFDVTFF